MLDPSHCLHLLLSFFFLLFSFFSFAAVLADARPAALFAVAFSAFVLADARPYQLFLMQLCLQVIEPPNSLHRDFFGC
jgi:hypothetical protein